MDPDSAGVNLTTTSPPLLILHFDPFTIPIFNRTPSLPLVEAGAPVGTRSILVPVLTKIISPSYHRKQRPILPTLDSSVVVDPLPPAAIPRLIHLSSLLRVVLRRFLDRTRFRVYGHLSSKPSRIYDVKNEQAGAPPRRDIPQHQTASTPFL
ncbi:unnamed protein product [Cyclocybe aegerita]|uniref:Uncharacterized protein n=1 Tax=Cyclocybe aegerita TaxID=1973307 RepID=A0A8S0X0Z6_CYCAE|nr:unnamed protein product [Cyclocybe aegerita]